MDIAFAFPFEVMMCGIDRRNARAFDGLFCAMQRWLRIYCDRAAIFVAVAIGWRQGDDKRSIKQAEIGLAVS